MALYSVEAHHQGQRGHLSRTDAGPVFIPSTLGGPAMPYAMAQTLFREASQTMPGLHCWMRRVG